MLNYTLEVSEMSSHKKNLRFNRLGPFLLPLLAIFLCSCSDNPTSPPSASFDLTNAEKTLIESDNKFGLKLFREINATQGDVNIFVSPLSISMALGMTLNGADGSTLEAMEQTLELSGLTLEEINESYRHLIDLLTQLDPLVQFDIANSIWYREDFQEPEAEFLANCGDYFDALVTRLNFTDPNAAATINAWVDENTNGKIKQIVQAPINPLTVMFLINAIYFKGMWKYQFDENLTQDDSFFLSDGSEISCNMMAQNARHKYCINDRFQSVDMPYGDGAFTMTVFLPRLDVDLDAFIATMEPDSLERWLQNLSGDSVDVYLPRFTLEYELSLNDALTALGMAIAFSPSGADFSKMYEDADIYISAVRHKTFVKVNEEGTEAAAVTSVVEGTTSGDDTFPPVFYANRPFVFMIRENESGTILFIGKIMDPTAE